MKRSLWTPILVVVAVASGLVVLLSYFLPVLISLRTLLLEWAMILGAVALFIGVLNLAQVHWRKIRSRQPGSGLSAHRR